MRQAFILAALIAICTVFLAPCVGAQALPPDEDPWWGTCPPTDDRWPTCLPTGEDGDGTGGGTGGNQSCCARYNQCFLNMQVAYDECLSTCYALFGIGDESSACIANCAAESDSNDSSCGLLWCGTPEPAC